MALEKSVLIIEDDAAIANLLRLNLVEEGFSASVASSAEAGFEMLEQQPYSLCLLDWMLPGVQGIDFLKQVREKNRFIKIMMLTAKVDSDSIVQAIEAGADDYLTKPFEGKVLSARVRNLFRRIDLENELIQRGKKSEDTEVFKSAGLRIDFAKYEVAINDGSVHLTPSEYKLLASLVKAQGRVLTRDQLITLIQGDDVTVTGRTVDTHMFALRKKLGSWSDHLETIRGVGYRVLVSNQDRSQLE